ncbi:unnamed protein product [Cochlearia groenlandica]
MITSSHYLLSATLIYSAASPSSQNVDKIIQTMIRAGDLCVWAADFISSGDIQFEIPLSATIFIPTDFAVAAVHSFDAANSSRLFVAYHIAIHGVAYTIWVS